MAFVQKRAGGPKQGLLKTGQILRANDKTTSFQHTVTIEG